MALARRTLKYIFPYKKKIVLGIISMICHSALTIYFVNVFREFIQTVIEDLSAGEIGVYGLTVIALGMLLVYFLKGITYFGQKYFISYVAQKAIRDIRNDLYSHLQDLSLGFYSQNQTGEIISRVTNDVRVLRGAIVDGAISLIYEGLTFVGGLGYLYYLNSRLTIFLIIVIPPITYVMKIFNTKIRKVSKDAQIKIADVSDILQETISAVRVVKSFGREDYEYDRFSSENHANFRAKIKNIRYKAVLAPAVELIAAFAFMVILWYGGYEVLHGRMSSSDLIAFFFTLFVITSPLKSLSKLSGKIQQAFAAAERIFETMDISSQVTENEEDKRKTGEIEGEIVFNNVNFSYKEEGETVLQNINLRAKPGEILALVGASGAGKTTLVDLIPRFFLPTEGEILLDGYNIQDINIDFLRKHIGIVPQETILFSGTVRDNIAYGNLEAGEDEIKEAARNANAHKFISEFKEGYDTVVGERGVGLSGGQRQRVAIARAILKDPRILILDEATSALDAESEALVQEALNVLMKNRTTFIIAHRLSTIINADKILVLDKGKIVEQGTHKELMKKRKIYYDLYQGQFREIALEG